MAGLLAMPFRQVWPRRRDDGELSGLVDAGLPSGTVTVSVQPLIQQRREVPAFVIAEGVYRPRTLESVLTSYVIRHRDATVLVDPALCADADHRIMPELPWMLRGAVRPMASALSTTSALHWAGITPRDIDFALATHLHWDHVSGLLDLPDLPLAVHSVEHDWITHGRQAPAGGVRSVMRGVA